MAQRFVRCQLCGLPHPAELALCPMHHKPIVPAARVSAERSSSTPPSPPESPPRSEANPHDRQHNHQRNNPASGVTRPTPESSLVGRVLQGRYQINAVLARGGMGVIYEGTQLGLDRTVAVKCLHPRYARDPSALARFHREARIVGSIGHPNVVEVFDLGALEDGAPYLVMERLFGETLAARMRGARPVSVSLAVSITSQVFSALQATHSRAVLHRDLKPDNVFLISRPGAEPLVKVLDFGVARDLAAASARLTRAGFVMGTPAYMAPEQARGEALDVRVDVYGVGALLYELLTGRVPYSARTPAALLGEMLRRPVPSPAALRPSLSLSLCAVVTRCLAFDRDARYPDVSSARDALLSATEVDDDAPTVLSDSAPHFE